jgi:hypothetical protein
MSIILHPLPTKEVVAEKALPPVLRRPHKRKLTTPLHREEENSCGSSDEDDSPTTNASAPGSLATTTCRSRKRYPVLSPASSCNSSVGLAISASPKTVPHDDSDSGSGGTGNAVGNTNGGTPGNGVTVSSASNSVKDLENAMSKHLPSTAIEKNASPQLHHQPTDFSTDTLLKQQQQRSTGDDEVWRSKIIATGDINAGKFWASVLYTPIYRTF